MVHPPLSQERKCFFFTNCCIDNRSAVSRGTRKRPLFSKDALNHWFPKMRISPPGKSSPFRFTKFASIRFIIAWTNFLIMISLWKVVCYSVKAHNWRTYMSHKNPTKTLERKYVQKNSVEHLHRIHIDPSSRHGTNKGQLPVQIVVA